MRVSGIYVALISCSAVYVAAELVSVPRCSTRSPCSPSCIMANVSLSVVRRGAFAHVEDRVALIPEAQLRERHRLPHSLASRENSAVVASAVIGSTADQAVVHLTATTAVGERLVVVLLSGRSLHLVLVESRSFVLASLPDSKHPCIPVPSAGIPGGSDDIEGVALVDIKSVWPLHCALGSPHHRTYGAYRPVLLWLLALSACGSVLVLVMQRLLRLVRALVAEVARTAAAKRVPFADAEVRSVDELGEGGTAHLELRGKIGEGSSAMVLDACWQGHPIAIKIPKHGKGSETGGSSCNREAALLRNLHHENICRLLGTVTLPDGGALLVLERLSVRRWRRRHASHLQAPISSPSLPRRARARPLGGGVIRAHPSSPELTRAHPSSSELISPRPSSPCFLHRLAALPIHISHLRAWEIRHNSSTVLPLIDPPSLQQSHSAPPPPPPSPAAVAP